MEAKLADLEEEIKEARADLKRAQKLGNVDLELKVNDRLNLLLEEKRDLRKGGLAVSAPPPAQSAGSASAAHGQFQQPDHVFTGFTISRYEAELNLTGISVQTGLQPGGSRGFVFNLVNTMTGVLIDGFVQRIPVHDLKVVIRGTEDHVQYVIGQLRGSIDCDIQEIRYGSYHAWPRDPRFKILRSATRRALKSDISDDAFDNKSIRSKSSTGSA